MAQTPLGYSAHDARRIASVVHAYEAGLLSRTDRQAEVVVDRNYAKIHFRNDNSGTVPAYGVMRVTGAARVDDVPLISIDKPNTTFARLYLVNGPNEVLAGKRGWGTWLWHADYVLYDTGNTPAFEESWGPQDGTWTLKKNRYGFTIMGGNTGTGATSRTIAVQHIVNHFYGQTDAAINKGSSGTVSVYDGANADTSINVSSVENKFGNVAISKKVSVTWEAGVWRFTSAEC